MRMAPTVFVPSTVMTRGAVMAEVNLASSPAELGTPPDQLPAVDHTPLLSTFHCGGATVYVMSSMKTFSPLEPTRTRFGRRPKRSKVTPDVRMAAVRSVKPVFPPCVELTPGM